MLPRSHINPHGHWRVNDDLAYSQGVRCGDFLFLGGQLALEQSGAAAAPDLEGQTEVVIGLIEKILKAARFELSDLVQLRGFYCQDGTVNEDDIAIHIGDLLGDLCGPGPVLTLIPLRDLNTPEMRIEIESIAMRGQNGEILARTNAWDPEFSHLPKPFSHALRVGEMVFTSGVSVRDQTNSTLHAGDIPGQCGTVLTQIDRLLGQLGADIQDVVKTNVYSADTMTKKNWSTSALTRAGFYREPGPALTGLTFPALWPKGVMEKSDVIAMRGENGERLSRTNAWPTNHWDWPVHVPYRHGVRCGDLVFIGGQVPLNPDQSVAHTGDVVAQTKMVMEYVRLVLAEFDLGFDNVVRMDTFYVGESGNDDWLPNLEARFAHFEAPGPATTGVPVPALRYKNMGIEIEVIAMA